DRAGRGRAPAAVREARRRADLRPTGRLVSAAAAVPPALDIRGLTKRFGATTAVDAIDLVVPGGSFYGVVGPNGAGKTTLLSMATGLLRPDAGTAMVHGLDVWRDPLA